MRTMLSVVLGLTPLLLLVAACGNGGTGGTTATPTLPDGTPRPRSASITAAPSAVSVAATPETTAVATAEASPADSQAPRAPEMQSFVLPPGSRPHDVAPAADGGVWYTAQGLGRLGWLDPVTGRVEEIALGTGSAPHGVIVGADGDAWVTDGGLNAIVRVDATTHAITRYDLPPDRPNANLNTATFDGEGRLWFTGQAGVYGRLDPNTGEMTVWDAPRGGGPYGIAATPGGDVYYASLAGSYLGEVDVETGEVTVREPPTPDQGTRRVWADSQGRLWTSQWNAGQVAVYDPATGDWQEWRLPGGSPSAYAVYVDENDEVWLSDFGGNAIHHFDPGKESFETFVLPDAPGNVRQLLGRPGEVWGAESAADKLVVIWF